MKKCFKIALVMLVCLAGIQGMAFGQTNYWDKELINAIRENNLQKVRNAISNGANVSCTFNQGNITKSALTLAVEINNVPLVQLLIDRGASIGIYGIQTETALMTAAKLGYADLARYLVSLGGDVNGQDLLGNTAMHYAAGADGSESVTVLVALMNSAARDSTAIRNKNGETPFMVAVRNENTTIVTALIDTSRFDVTKPDDSGVPPILAAIELGINLETLRYMLQKSTLAPRDIMDRQTRNAYDYVRLYRNNNASFLRLLNEYQSLKG